MPDDLHTLTDAFAELERRADAAAADPAPAPAGGHRYRTLLVAASVVAVAVVATGSALLANSHDSGRAPAAGPQPSSAAPSNPAPSTSAPSTSAPTSSGPDEPQIPKTAQELADRFRQVLDGSATFSQRDVGASGAFITGTLSSGGSTGGFDLQIFRSGPGAKPICEDPDIAICTVRQLPGGSSLATGHEALQNDPDGVTYQADLVRSDGVQLVMHVSNERDPKGESAVLGAHPPLSIDDMVAIVTSDRW